jgi:hypothetical protein
MHKDRYWSNYDYLNLNLNFQVKVSYRISRRRVQVPSIQVNWDNLTLNNNLLKI